MELFCQQQDLAMSTFQRWRSTIHRSKALGTSETPSGFTRVMPPPAIKPTPLASIPPAITVQVGTSITLTIHTTESVWIVTVGHRSKFLCIVIRSICANRSMDSPASCPANCTVTHQTDRFICLSIVEVDIRGQVSFVEIKLQDWANLIMNFTKLTWPLFSFYYFLWNSLVTNSFILSTFSVFFCYSYVSVR